ncbi:hypothetical protein CQ018_19385 [Arthrobacter sp. MYb227]|uniref:hypothetical protein n=1 Tax=Arthrobacter sp. MYb227 TaxID=1848601 RepID=UPI000CFD2F1F|nr:hypothetical protein [Arthrobacter sp. MYb227]PQZ85945.1 hypothetical protein CQ018_19385 [Arthrobacter sp. MYb227]
MSTRSQQPPTNELDPVVEKLLKSADPFDALQNNFMEHSRLQSSTIPRGSYVPPISQLTHTHKSAPKARVWGTVFALAASAAIIMSLSVFVPWGDGAPSASSRPQVGGTPSSSEFNINDPAQLAAFQATGGKRITGFVRAVLPTDPPELRHTGWLINTFTVAGTGKTVDHAAGPWAPIDLSGRDISRLGGGPDATDLVVVLTKQSDLSVVVPLAGPYGIMVSDPQKLATSTLGDSSSLTTLEGNPLENIDTPFNGAILAQFARFGLSDTFVSIPASKPIVFTAQEFDSYTGSDAQSCIAATIGSQTKILAFPVGATAAASIETEWLDKDLVAHSPLRIMPKHGWFIEGDESTFILDTGTKSDAMFKAWPTGEAGACGGLTGEIINFAGRSK